MMFYLGCTDCHRKVTDEGTGYRCENCDKTFATCQPTYMLNAKISDFSDSIYVQVCRELGDIIMGGMTAAQFKAFKEDSENPTEAIKELVRDLTFKVTFTHTTKQL